MAKPVEMQFGAWTCIVAVVVLLLGEDLEPCIRWEPEFPKVKGQFWGIFWPIVNYREYPS